MGIYLQMNFTEPKSGDARILTKTLKTVKTYKQIFLNTAVIRLQRICEMKYLDC